MAHTSKRSLIPDEMVRVAILVCSSTDIRTQMKDSVHG
jgi:hypothetical protein